ncbi:hypothetical protein GCM10009127_25980 [Alteraurantiacibacter aestuarii]
MVARAEQGLVLIIVDGEGEIAQQVRRTAGAPSLPGGKDDGAIGKRRINAEFGSQPGTIIQASIGNSYEGTGPVQDRRLRCRRF